MPLYMQQELFQIHSFLRVVKSSSIANYHVSLRSGAVIVIEVEVQNETHQSQLRMRFAAVPRIGEGVRLREPDGIWASYDVLDVWYQKAEFGDVWMPYLHIRMTPGEGTIGHEGDEFGQFETGVGGYGGEFEPFKI